ncbi:MAG: choice-of-anchor B family protein [Saprospiraceae bacterium]|nr:choice-of-anchor B family protein [Saprospiraceae bacterium]
MMRRFLLFFLTVFCSTLISAQGSLNVSLVAQFHRGDTRYSGSWSYTDPDGVEYAILGAKTGAAIYKINTNGVEEVAFIPGPVTNWREITVVGHHAYVVTDVSGTGHGMQVIDLSQLPDTASLVTTYTATFTLGHIIQRDIFSEAPYVYVCGTSTSQGVHIMDVSNPAQPVEAGLYQPGYYIHDCHVRGDLMYAAAFYAGTIDIVDISDKSQPQLISRFSISDGYTHSASTTTDGKYLFVAPEHDGLPARMFNVEDPLNVYEVASYTGNPQSLVHNPYILGNFAFVSHNTEGLRVVDIADPEFPVEVGYYDTYAGPSGGFYGLWSACPYLPSGRIIGGNREDGLYVWSFNGTQAGRRYVYVRDAVTGAPLPGARAITAFTADTLFANLEGLIKAGNLAGNYTWDIAASGYQSVVFSTSLSPGVSDTVIVVLEPIPVGAQEPTAKNGLLQIAPNPASDLITILLTGNELPTTLELYTLTGTLLQRWSPCPAQIDVSAFPQGIYYLRAIQSSLPRSLTPSHPHPGLPTSPGVFRAYGAATVRVAILR